MRYHTEHKEQTKLKVLTEAAEAIRASGVENISVQGVMSRAGLTQGGFYAHFKSKDELIAMAVPLMFDDSYQRFLQASENAEPEVALTSFVDRYLSTRHRDNPGRGCPVPTLSADLARMPEFARKNFGDGVKRLTRSISVLLKKMELPHEDELAASLLAEMVGALSMARTVHGEKESEAILKQSRFAIRRRLGLLD